MLRVDKTRTISMRRLHFYPSHADTAHVLPADMMAVSIVELTLKRLPAVSYSLDMQWRAPFFGTLAFMVEQTGQTSANSLCFTVEKIGRYKVQVRQWHLFHYGFLYGDVTRCPFFPIVDALMVTKSEFS